MVPPGKLLLEHEPIRTIHIFLVVFTSVLMFVIMNRHKSQFQNVNMASMSASIFCVVCQKLRSVMDRNVGRQLNYERTGTSSIIYFAGVTFIMCLLSWISVNLRLITTYTGLKRDTASHEMLSFGERSVRYVLPNPNPKTPPVETEAWILNGEAAAALHMALKMNEEGKSGKALKLFQQALKLSPSNADVLNSYGEFLEHEKLIEAENLYTRALINNPLHSRALANRQRTLPMVQKMDQDMLSRIDDKRFKLYKIPEEDAALQRAMKEAYYQYIHHTTAIEGNTMTLSMARAVVETKMAISGKSVLEHNEILGLDEALKYVNTTLVQGILSITVQNIIEIHRRVLGHAHPLEAGQFRSTQVYVGNHVPPHPTDVEQFMDEFDSWLRSRSVRKFHPIEFSALAHYRLVYIHPFTDGNGRTARLLMNLILMRAGFPPVTIKVSDRHDYYACLQDANRGDVRPFIRFVAKCAERTLDEYLSATAIYPVKHYSYRGLDHSNHLNNLDTVVLAG